VRCSAELLQCGGQQAASVLHVLQQNPLLRDTFATIVATAGAVALVKIFRALSFRGIVDQVSRNASWIISFKEGISISKRMHCLKLIFMRFLKSTTYPAAEAEPEASTHPGWPWFCALLASL